MLIAEAHVPTERSSRYLVQLCQYVYKAARAHPQMQAHVEWSDDRGVISLGWGRCTLRADPGVLTLRAEAPDEESLRQLEQRVADRLEQVGRRDRLTVTWTRSQVAGSREDADMTDRPGSSGTTDDSGMSPDRGPMTGTPRWVKVFGTILAIVVLLFVIVLLTRGPGGHGPGRHTQSGEPGGQAPPASVVDERAPSGGRTPPAGGDG